MNKKILKILSVVLAAALAASGFAACSSHEHDVSKWVTVTEATCSSKGVEQGICSTCGETVTRETDYDADNHNYGDWQILSYPTESRTGTAKNICADCGNELMVSLPVLSDSRYTSSITQRPTATENGVRSYSLYNEHGNIEFTVEISSTGITSVRDAVEVSCDDVSHAAVRSGAGTVTNSYYEAGPTASSSTSYKFSYEYGKNYTHIDDTASDGKERWYGIDSDGDIYGYRSDYGGTPFDETKTTSGAAYYIYGYRYIFEYSTYVGTYYGTENFISGLYNAAKQNENNDFEESVTEYANGDITYAFSYGKYTINGNSGGYFSIVNVSFTLSDEYTIKSCTATCTMYVNGSDDESNTWKINSDGYAEVTAYTGMRYVSTFTVEQVTKTEDPEEPVNPYDADSMRISSFDLYYNDTIDASGNYVSENDVLVTEDTVITITAAVATRASYSSGETDEDGNLIYNYANAFRIENVLPSTMADNVSDDLAFYYRSYSGSSYVDYEINSSTALDTSTSVGVACNFSSSTNSFFILSKISGYVDVVLKTHNTETVIHFYVTPIAPSTLYPMLYKYSTSGYSWSSSYSTAVEGTVYVGQNLYFSTEVPDTESRYADNAYVATVTSAVAGGNTISSAYYTLTDELTFNGQSMSAFNATVAGTYTITLVSIRDSEIVSTITVTVKDAPERSELFSASYIAKLSYAPAGNVTVSFEADASSDGVYYATISSATTTEVLKCYYDGNVLTTEHYSGADNGFTLTFNEAYDLVISHSTGYYDDELETDIMETVILTKQS